MEEFSSPDWDSVPDVDETGRSFVPFPDPNPEFIAGVWDRWHSTLERRQAAEKREALSDDSLEVFQGYEAPVIVEPATEFDDPCRPLAGLIKLAVANGWEIVEIAHAVSTMKGKPYSGGEKEGQFRPDRTTDLQWAKFEKASVGRILLSFPIVNDEVRSTNVVRSFNGRRYGDRDMRKVMKGEYEESDID